MLKLCLLRDTHAAPADWVSEIARKIVAACGLAQGGVLALAWPEDIASKALVRCNMR